MVNIKMDNTFSSKSPTLPDKKEELSLRHNLLSCVYLTRACPMRCRYCSLRDSPLIRGKELTLEEWKEAFSILHSLGVKFNLILGNESLTLSDNLFDILKHLHSLQTSYGLYTTFPETLWQKYRKSLLKIGVKNLSCGLDTLPELTNVEKIDDITEKSFRGFEALKWAKQNGVLELHATITLSKMNLETFPYIVQRLTSYGIWTEVNPIHYAKDDFYDFFPPRKEIEDLLFTEKDLPTLVETVNLMKALIKNGKVMCHNVPEFFDDLLEHGINLDWHCQHLLMLSVDADGVMRVCGYRKGNRVKNYTIFDLPQQWDDFVKDWKKDSNECPGCVWSCYWSAEYYHQRNPEFGVSYFQTHDSEYWRKSN